MDGAERNWGFHHVIIALQGGDEVWVGADFDRVESFNRRRRRACAGDPEKFWRKQKIEVAWTSPATTGDLGSISVGQATQLRATPTLDTCAADGTPAPRDGSHLKRPAVPAPPATRQWARCRAGECRRKASRAQARWRGRARNPAWFHRAAGRGAPPGRAAPDQGQDRRRR